MKAKKKKLKTVAKKKTNRRYECRISVLLPKKDYALVLKHSKKLDISIASTVREVVKAYYLTYILTEPFKYERS